MPKTDRTNWREEQDEILLRMHAEGHDDASISAATHYDVQTVIKHREKLGLPPVVVGPTDTRPLGVDRPIKDSRHAQAGWDFSRDNLPLVSL